MTSVVAPCAGAWIEMAGQRWTTWSGWSLPVRERGLKCCWLAVVQMVLMSLPVRERGLKYNYQSFPFFVRESLPVRERGLK